MRFPRTIRHRKAQATIYGKSKSYPFYRVAHRLRGKRFMKSFDNYFEAKAHAEKLVKDIASGSQAAALDATKARDAIAAFDRLEAFRQSTGRTVKLLEAVSAFCDVQAKLGDRNLYEAADGFLNTVAVTAQVLFAG
jgi:hypothetical protein